MKNTLKTILQGAALYGALASTSAAQEQKPTIKTGYNALELAVFEDAPRIKLLTNVSYGTDQFRVGYWGLNEGNDEFYFGRHIFTFGPDKSTRVAIQLKTNQDGLIDYGVGVRNTFLPKKIGADYGYIDAIAGEDNVNATTLLGFDFKEGKYSVEVVQGLTVLYKGEVSTFSDIQGIKHLNKKFSVAARFEIIEFDLNTTNLGVMGVIKF